MSVDRIDFNNIANVEGEWFINEYLDLAYLSVLASDFVPSDTSADVDSNHMSVIDALTSLHAPIRPLLWCTKRPMTRKEPSLKSQQSTRVKSQFYLGGQKLNQWFVKV